MLKKYVLVMDMCKFVVILILYFSSSSCYPAKPLNERSPDLTWEAWLLVDEQQNQNKQPSDGVLRRRITPKSVFIAPTFSPESLPACAEGYSSDHLGRCIKIIKLDQAAHYDFLIERLKEKFSPADYEDDYYDDTEATPGPFQVNIPLGIQTDDDDAAEEIIEESDVAIIVSPTKPQINVDKRASFDASKDEAKQENLLKRLAEPTTTEITTTTISDTTTASTQTETTPTETTTIAETTTNSEPTTTDGDRVRFTDDPLHYKFRFPGIGDIAASSSTSVNHVPRAAESRQLEEPVEPVNFDFLASRDSRPTATPHTPVNRRNRDRNNGLFMLPPRWSDSSYQRPVVLRFSRKHAYLDMEQFKKPNYYRSIPTDDFAYLFKFKHKQR
ncbi:unnamed protein product [Phyllotreta striolata]|uniref:Folded gastrulation N-terminal domain-containing protein n=1 Tax=Phyllotreta striolata TaxID=444603 RepID=A0A9N9XNB9_PHYSR|nr:unnamed protein product [Phyllotreta striolata]